MVFGVAMSITASPSAGSAPSRPSAAASALVVLRLVLADLLALNLPSGPARGPSVHRLPLRLVGLGVGEGAPLSLVVIES